MIGKSFLCLHNTVQERCVLQIVCVRTVKTNVSTLHKQRLYWKDHFPCIEQRKGKATLFLIEVRILAVCKPIPGHSMNSVGLRVMGELWGTRLHTITLPNQCISKREISEGANTTWLPRELLSTDF